MRWIKAVETFLAQWSSPAVRQEAESAEQAAIPEKSPEKKQTESPSESRALNIIMGTLWCMALVACPFFLIIFVDFKNWKLRPINLFSGWQFGNTYDFHKRSDWNRRRYNDPMRVGSVAYYTRGPYRRRI